MEIKKGERYVCMSDVIMNDGTLAYKRNAIYTSEKEGCLTDELELKDHWLDEDYLEKYFIPYCENQGSNELNTEVLDDTIEEKLSILLEAHGILHGDRQADYGDAVENFENIATVARLLGVEDIDAEDCCKVLIALKICREGFKHKRDNLTDLAAYTEILNKIMEHKQEQNNGTD